MRLHRFAQRPTISGASKQQRGGDIQVASGSSGQGAQREIECRRRTWEGEMVRRIDEAIDAVILTLAMRRLARRLRSSRGPSMLERGVSAVEEVQTTMLDRAQGLWATLEKAPALAVVSEGLGSVIADPSSAIARRRPTIIRFLLIFIALTAVSTAVSVAATIVMRRRREAQDRSATVLAQEPETAPSAKEPVAIPVVVEPVLAPATGAWVKDPDVEAQSAAAATQASPLEAGVDSVPTKEPTDEPAQTPKAKPTGTKAETIPTEPR
jgi:hypothetical protein